MTNKYTDITLHKRSSTSSIQVGSYNANCVLILPKKEKNKPILIERQFLVQNQHVCVDLHTEIGNVIHYSSGPLE